MNQGEVASKRMFEGWGQNVVNGPLVPLNKIILPNLHIKLGLMKQFIKALYKDRDYFSYIRYFSPEICEAKTKGILDGPQIPKLLRDFSFKDFSNVASNSLDIKGI